MRHRGPFPTLGYEEYIALVADFLAEDDEALAALFRRLFPALRARGFTSALTYFLGSPRIDSRLRAGSAAWRRRSGRAPGTP